MEIVDLLAKYGHIEPADGGAGREKPWKLVSLHHSVDMEGQDFEGQLALEALSEVVIDHHAAQHKEYVRRASREPEEWLDRRDPDPALPVPLYRRPRWAARPRPATRTPSLLPGA